MDTQTTSVKKEILIMSGLYELIQKLGIMIPMETDTEIHPVQ